MTALVSLPCCLSGNAKLSGDLRPAGPKSTARSTTASSSASTAPRADRARLSRSKISVEDRWEGRCAEPAASTDMYSVWLDLAWLALCVDRRLGLLMPSIMRDSRQRRSPCPPGPRRTGGSRKARAEGSQPPPLAARCRTVRCDAHHILLLSRSLAVGGGRLRSVAYISDRPTRSTGICIAAAIAAQLIAESWK